MMRLAVHLLTSNMHFFSLHASVSENWVSRVSSTPVSKHAGILFGGNILVVQGGVGLAGPVISTQAINFGSCSVSFNFEIST